MKKLNLTEVVETLQLGKKVLCLNNFTSIRILSLSEVDGLVALNPENDKKSYGIIRPDFKYFEYEGGV